MFNSKHMVICRRPPDREPEACLAGPATPPVAGARLRQSSLRIAPSRCGAGRIDHEPGAARPPAMSRGRAAERAGARAPRYRETREAGIWDGEEGFAAR